MARCVADVALMHGALTGGTFSDTARTFTFGVPRPYFCDFLDDDTASALARAVEALAAAGHRVVDVPVAGAHWTPSVYLHIVLPEASWYHAAGLGAHADRYSPGVRIRLEMGRYILAEDYVRAMWLRGRLSAHVDRALEKCDVLLVPTLPTAAPPLGATTVEAAGRREPVRAAMLRLTQLFNLTGHAALALPAAPGRDGLPRGLQVVCRETSRVIEAGLALERCLAD
jgi:aspartyl-tRNA(Asn)/glutamyl-tRNA(Gln) amidotransferase subunit A